MPPFFHAHTTPALLALADGTVFTGFSIGAEGQVTGEVVFNTAMTGYQEILTDPSYHSQIVTLTYPHIGNTGVNAEDIESARVHVAGLVIKDLPLVVSSFRSAHNLSFYLQNHNVMGIAGIDTRRLTRILREKGAQGGVIFAGANATQEKALEWVALAQSFVGLDGRDLAQGVSIDASCQWSETEWVLGKGYGKQITPKYHVVAFDYGVKFNILRMIAERGCKITLLPAKATAADALALRPDGIFLSNGPGDPAACDYAVATAKTLIEKGLPTFGICLGHQIMALACGATTLKMKFGHHGANHPVQDVHSKRVMITSQNHGFAVDAATLPANCRVTHVSLFDGSLQGFERTDKPAFCFQGHPEASPGPHDIAPLFDRFVALMEKNKHAQA